MGVVLNVVKLMKCNVLAIAVCNEMKVQWLKLMNLTIYSMGVASNVV